MVDQIEMFLLIYVYDNRVDQLVSTTPYKNGIVKIWYKKKLLCCARSDI